MDGNKDVQGVSRGKCTMPACSCPGYSGGAKGLKCEHSDCKHPPAKHENLSTLGSAGAGVGGPRSYARVAAPRFQGGFSDPGYYQSAGPLDQGVGGQFNSWSQPSPHSGPKCKALGCQNPVHYEPGVGMFDYCSPACRDDHLLEKNKSQLKQDVQRLAQDLRTSLKSGSGSNKSKGGDKVPQQRTRNVHFQKRQGQDLGVMVYEDIYALEHIRGFLVTGVQVGSTASDMVQTAELRLLDIVTHVNGIPFDELSGPFDEEMQRSATASFVLNSTLSIVCPPSLFTKARATHVVALMNPYQFELQEFGFDVRKNPGQEGLAVTAVTKGTVAQRSGLKFNDIIFSFAIGTKDSVEKPKTCSDYERFTQALREACVKGKLVVLVIRRSKPWSV